MNTFLVLATASNVVVILLNLWMAERNYRNAKTNLEIIKAMEFVKSVTGVSVPIPPGECLAPDCDCKPGQCFQRDPATFTKTEQPK